MLITKTNIKVLIRFIKQLTKQLSIMENKAADNNRSLKVILSIAVLLLVGTAFYSYSLYNDSVDTKKQLTEEKLHEVCGLLCVNFLSQSSFHSTLKSNLPTLKEGIIYFNVSNQVQFNDFKDHKQSIYDFLRAKLSVQNIRIEVKVNKIASSNVAAYTDRDKYDIMLKHNPKLGELKAQFGLEPDF